MGIQKIMVLLLLTSIGYGQTLGEWRWADDTSEFTMDKEAHFVGSAGAYFFFRHKGYSQYESMEYSLYLGLAKECIDAMLPYEKYGRWGGDGFSKYDLMYDILGILTAYGIDKLWKPKEENKGVAVKLDNNRVMFEWKLK
jgi:hypothetical protein